MQYEVLSDPDINKPLAKSNLAKGLLSWLLWSLAFSHKDFEQELCIPVQNLISIHWFSFSGRCMDAKLSKVFRRLHSPVTPSQWNVKRHRLSRTCTILLRTLGPGHQKVESRHRGRDVRWRHVESSDRRNYSLFAWRFVARFRIVHSSWQSTSRRAVWFSRFCQVNVFLFIFLCERLCSQPPDKPKLFYNARKLDQNSLTRLALIWAVRFKWVGIKQPITLTL